LFNLNPVTQFEWVVFAAFGSFVDSIRAER
jgi:hypothetical protein